MSSPLPWSQARALVTTEVARARGAARPRTEAVDLAEAAGRVLAVPVLADRDQPPFPRSTRDGFALRAVDLTSLASLSPDAPVRLRVLGEVAAGASFAGTVGPGEAVEIMTGAPVPAGADAVVMIEYTTRPSSAEVVVTRGLAAGDNVVPRGSELAAGALAYPAGNPLDPAAIALLASLGCARPHVYARPRVAILGTGDELVPVEATPALAQIRDSNRHCLAASITRAGGEPLPLPLVPDDRVATERALDAAAAQADLVLITGGVSMGKYDHVEPALKTLAARVIFDAVAIRPGKPLVFGFLHGKPFFGLPGNPLSAQVTFELFARAALDLLAGRPSAAPLPFFGAQLASDHTQRAVPLTVFVPARFQRGADVGPPRVAPVPSQGSGDLAAMAAADGFVVLEPGVGHVPSGSWVSVLPK
jgi:molybdopterin molybdotransferase